jgi:2,3-bisphosphoglycerate-dependent phosphoglycerate mutase
MSFSSPVTNLKNSNLLHNLSLALTGLICVFSEENHDASMNEIIPIHHIVFLRHGESVGNAEDRFQGQYDFPLTEKGRAQAKALADRWLAEGVTFERCISSPLLRAAQTAEIIAPALNIPLEFDPVWKELHNGGLARLDRDEAAERFPRPDFIHPYLHIGETGESRWEVYLRAGRGVQSLLDRGPGRYLIVAHGGILNMAMYAILGIPVQADYTGPTFRFLNTSFATLTYTPEEHHWRLIGLNDRAHWRNEDE